MLVLKLMLIFSDIIALLCDRISSNYIIHFTIFLKRGGSYFAKSEKRKRDLLILENYNFKKVFLVLEHFELRKLLFCNVLLKSF